MHTNKLDIRLFLADQELQHLLEDIPHCEDCEQVITSAQLFSASDVAHADLVIGDGALVSAHTLRKACPARTIIIYCTKHTKNPDAVPNLYDLVDEIWVQPLSPAYARARFIKNLQLLKKQKTLPLSQNTVEPDGPPLPEPTEVDNTQLDEAIEAYKCVAEYFNTTALQNGIVTWMYDIENSTLCSIMNPLDVLGLPEQQVKHIPQFFMESTLLHKDDLDCFIKLHDAIKSGTTAAPITVRVRKNHEQDWSWFQLSYTIVDKADHQPLHAIGSARDITPQIKAEQQYRTQLAYRDSMSQNAVATMVLNLTNNTVLEVRGDFVPGGEHSTVDALFAAIKAQIPAPLTPDSHGPEGPDDPLVTTFYDREHLLHAFNTGLSSPSVSHLYGASLQQASWVKVTASIIKKPGTTTVEAFVQVSDIDGEKIVESSYSAASSRENDSISCINVAKASISFVYDKVASHKASEKAMAYPEYLQEMCKAHLRPEDREDFCSAMNLETIAQALAQQPLYSTHCHMQDPAGNLRQKRILCSYMDENRQLVCMVTSDITETSRTEQRRNIVLRRALEAAEKSSKAKRSFLTTLSHEIRTPMNTIIGMSEILLDKELAPEIALNIGIIQNVGASLLSIINEILSFSRLESGKPEHNGKSCLPSSRTPSSPLPAPIVGIDLERALSTYTRLEIYHDIIKVYGQDIAARAPQLQQFLKQGDLEAFSISIHTLKSASRGVGATALGDAAEKLEALAVTGQLAAVEELFPPFMQALDTMVANVGRYIRQYLSSPSSKLPKQQHDTFDNATVDALKAACTALDYDLAEVIVDELDMYEYPQKWQELLTRMKKCCADFDYTELDALAASLT